MVTLDDDRLGELLVAEAKLNALEATGVNNWDGYEIAMNLAKHMLGEESMDEDESEEEADARHRGEELQDETEIETEEEADIRHITGGRYA